MKQERSRVVLRIEEDGKKEVQKEANNWPYKKERKQANGHILACGMQTGMQTAVSRVRCVNARGQCKALTRTEPQQTRPRSVRKKQLSKQIRRLLPNTFPEVISRL